MSYYIATITPVLEYTVPMWQSIPDYLADVIESESVKMGTYGTFPCGGILYGGPWSSKLDDSAREKRRFML